jgi:hypothetical protein
MSIPVWRCGICTMRSVEIFMADWTSFYLFSKRSIKNMFISIYFLSLADKFLFVYFSIGGILMHAGSKII